MRWHLFEKLCVDSSSYRLPCIRCTANMLLYRVLCVPQPRYKRDQHNPCKSRSITKDTAGKGKPVNARTLGRSVPGAQKNPPRATTKNSLINKYSAQRMGGSLSRWRDQPEDLVYRSESMLKQEQISLLTSWTHNISGAVHGKYGSHVRKGSLPGLSRGKELPAPCEIICSCPIH